MGMQSDALRDKPTSLDELFESSTWKIKNIWDGVKLEIAPGDGCPVVLNSFTHLDPDLPVLEVVLHRFKLTYFHYCMYVCMERERERERERDIQDVCV